MLNKFLCLLSSFLYVLGAAQGIEKNDFMQRSLEKIESQVKNSSTLKEKALHYQNLEKWYYLLAELNISKSEKKEILETTHPTIDFLTKEYHQFAEYFFADEDRETIPVIYQNEETVAFLNLDEKRFDQELESYHQHKNFEPIVLTKKSLKKLELNVHYNFVITLDGKMILGKLQKYDELFEGDRKILLAPNHAILADGKPVVAAGELEILGKDVPIFFASLTSGHYHPSLESKKHIYNKLLEFEILAPQIILLDFEFEKLGWKFLEE